MKFATRMILIVMSASLLFSIVLGSYFIDGIADAQEKQLQKRISRNSKLLESVNSVTLYNYDREKLRNNLKAFFKSDDVFSIRLRELKGDINLFFTKGKDVVLKNRKIVVTLLSVNDEVIGEITTTYTTDIMKARLDSLTLNVFVVALLLQSVIALLVFIFIKKFTNPISKLTVVSSKMAAGDFNQRIDITSNDEIGVLSKSFNKMSDSIQNQVRILEVENKNRMEAETELAFSQEQYKALFESANDAIFIHAHNGDILDVNQTMVDMYSMGSKSEVFKLPKVESYSSKKNDFGKMEELWKKVLADNTQEFEWKAKRPHDGTVFDVKVSLKRIFYGGKSLIMATVRDITKQKKIEVELIQSQKMETIGTLAGGLAHDFNNVLSGITGSLSLIQHKMKSTTTEKIRKDLIEKNIKTIELSSLRAAKMVNQLLTLSRKQKVDIKSFDVFPVVQHVRDIASNSFDKSILLDFPEEPTAIMINGDATQIEQVILNICLNAAHSMTIMRNNDNKWGGSLTVKFLKIHPDKFFCKSHPDADLNLNYHVIAVSDTGVGISDEIKKRIFNPFFTTKDKGKGTGLGLSMVYNIIKQHDGFIDVYSEVDKGTTISIYLPMLNDEAIIKQASIEEETKFTTASGLILIVDDEEVIRKTAKEMLNEFGFDVIIAKDGQEGLSIFEKRFAEIDVVLLDMVMPKMSGKETYMKMKKIDKDIKVMLSSGFKQDNRVKEVLELGVSFIQKPYSYNSLTQKIAELIN